MLEEAERDRGKEESNIFDASYGFRQGCKQTENIDKSYANCSRLQS